MMLIQEDVKGLTKLISKPIYNSVTPPGRSQVPYVCSMTEKVTGSTTKGNSNMGATLKLSFPLSYKDKGILTSMGKRGKWKEVVQEEGREEGGHNKKKRSRRLLGKKKRED